MGSNEPGNDPDLNTRRMLGSCRRMKAIKMTFKLQVPLSERRQGHE